MDGAPTNLSKKRGGVIRVHEGGVQDVEKKKLVCFPLGPSSSLFCMKRADQKFPCHGFHVTFAATRVWALPETSGFKRSNANDTTRKAKYSDCLGKKYEFGKREDNVQ